MQVDEGVAKAIGFQFFFDIGRLIVKAAHDPGRRLPAVPKLPVDL